MGGSVEELVYRYRQLGLGGLPMTLNQIAELERHLGIALPAVYRAYLRVAGAGPPPGLVGSDCHGPTLYQLRTWAEEMLEESGRPFVLPADAVVFLMHQGYQFFYFRADGVEDDPAVFHYFENWPGPERRYERFSVWVACVS